MQSRRDQFMLWARVSRLSGSHVGCGQGSSMLCEWLCQCLRAPLSASAIPAVADDELTRLGSPSEVRGCRIALTCCFSALGEEICALSKAGLEALKVAPDHCPAPLRSGNRRTLRVPVPQLTLLEQGFQRLQPVRRPEVAFLFRDGQQPEEVNVQVADVARLKVQAPGIGQADQKVVAPGPGLGRICSPPWPSADGSKIGAGLIDHEVRPAAH